MRLKEQDIIEIAKMIDEVNFSGSKKPYASKGVYYIRIADEDRVLQPHELRQLFEYDKNISWGAELTDYIVNELNHWKHFIRKQQHEED